VLVEGRIEVTASSLEGVPDTLPRAPASAARVGRDVFGGRPDLTGLAQVIVQPAPALSLQGGRAQTRVQGPVVARAAPRVAGRHPSCRCW
jgi:hypothetical protein